jgi:hypothetical protein
MKSVVAHFIADPHSDQRSTANAKRQAKNVDERKSFLPEKIANSDFDVVTNHMKG